MFMAEVVVKILNEDGTPKTPEQIQGEREAIIALGDTPIVPGSATDHGFLLASLQDERKKRNELEDELRKLKESPASANFSSEEGKELQRQISESTQKIEELSRDNAKKDLLMAHPELKEKWEEFEKFREI